MKKYTLFFLMVLVAFVFSSCGGNSTSENKGPEYVDLGLPSGTKWATFNLGATIPEELGDYYAWGATEKRDYFSWGNYKWCEGDEKTLTKYCTSSNYGTSDYKTILDPSDDAARVQWGENWRMPTKEEFKELFRECNWQLGTLNGVYGYTAVGPNGNSIFLPFSGLHGERGILDYKEAGCYWSTSLDSEYVDKANCLYISPGYVDDKHNEWRYYGLSIRPVYVNK